MLLIHLSDIHFRASDIGTAQDPNFALRNEIVRDCRDMCRQLSARPDAIVVSGDIAYAGQKAEYDFATRWLGQLAEACDVSLSEVFVCPGNHDVDRKMAGRVVNQILHKSIKDANEVTRQTTIQGILQDEDLARFIYQPLDDYNLFAGQFFCDMNAPDRTRAVRDLKFNDGSTLRLWGLNTAFVSSAADIQGDLFVDGASLQITREAGVENAVAFHHPASWLRNGQELSDHLNAVSRLQMCGHEHLGRIEQHLRHVKLRASAAHPDRHEANWTPGFNFIDLDIEGTGETRTMRVKVHVRVWNAGTQRFQASHNDVGGQVWEQSIQLDPWRAATAPATTAEPVQVALGEPTDEPNDQDMSSLREIGVKFYALSFSKKNEIAGRLGLLEDADLNQPDFERFRRVFQRAHERGLLAALEAAVSNAQKNN